MEELAGTELVQSQALFGEGCRHLVGQGIKRRSFVNVKASVGGSVAKATGGGVLLDDDLSTVVCPSFGVLSERQLVALDLFLPSSWRMGDVFQRTDFGLNSFEIHLLRLDLHLPATGFVVEVILGAAL